MNIQITLTEEDLKKNIVIQSLKQMLQANTTISIDDSIKQNKTIVAPQVDIDDCDFVENVVKPKTEVNNVDKEVQKLKDFANSIYKQLNEKSQKSLTKFVEFYTDKIVNNGFRINPKNNWEKWVERDLNLK